jgi:glycosyltransferase involved in cell wall biosynthesis
MGLRVLLAITKSELGGAQRYVDQLVRLLPRHGFQPAVACGGDGWLAERARAAGAEVIPVPSLSSARTFRWLSEVQALREMQRIVREGNYAVVHGNSTRAGFLARLAAHRAGVPAIIFTAHGFFFAERMTGWRQAVYITAERLAALWSDAIITVSDSDRAAALRAGLGPEEKLITIRNGLDADACRRLREVRENGGRPAAGSGDPSGPLVASVANLYPTKGLEHLVVAMAEVRRMEPSARLLIVGEGPERPRLEALTRAHGLEGSVRLAGKMADPWSLLSEAEVFVLSSVKEGLPFVLLEAMAAGIPIVASRVGGVPEIVAHEQSALLVSPGDPMALGHAICRLLRNPGLAADLARSAQAALLREGLTADAMVAATADLYRKLLAAKRVL